MKTYQYISIPLLLLLFATARCNGQDSGIGQFKWLIGQWKGEIEGAQLYESWSVQDERTMVGAGYVVAGGDTVVHELLRIQKIGEYWTYIPIINGKPPVLFHMIKSESGIWTFENKEHDFPQRVNYTREKDGTLLAWIEGNLKGKEKKEEYRMTPVK